MENIDMNYRKRKKAIKKVMDYADKRLEENPLSSVYMSLWRDCYRQMCLLKAEKLRAKGKI